MKVFQAALFALLLCACASNSNSTKAPLKEIAVYQSTNAPTQKFIVLRRLTDDGREAEETEITEKFITQARKLGGDALILYPLSQSGMEVVPFGFGKINYTYLFKADVIRFVQP